MHRFRVGDRVYFAREDWYGTVREVDNVKAAVRWEDWDGLLGTVDTRDLVLASEIPLTTTQD